MEFEYEEIITGQEISYLHICERKLWLFRHGIRPEMEYGNVQIGMLIGEKSFSREKKEIPLGEWGVLDWADFDGGIIHETKKGRSPGHGDRAQVGYYLWLLNTHGVRVDQAQIHYPVIRKTDVVEWNDECARQVENDIMTVRDLVRRETPPPLIRKGICRKCAYEEVCFA